MQNFKIDFQETFLQNTNYYLDKLNLVKNVRLSNSNSLRFGSKGSLQLDLKTGLFYCFELEKGYNIYSFLLEYLGYSKESIKAFFGLEGNAYKDGIKQIEENLPLFKQVWNKGVYLEKPNEYLKDRGIKFVPKASIKVLNKSFAFEKEGLYLKEDTLLVPLLDKTNNLHGLQIIHPSYSPKKRFVKESKPKGNFCKLITNEKDKRIFLVEGFEDGLSLNQAGVNALVCFNASNLVDVAYALRKDLRGNAYCFADNDGVGLEKADDAATILGSKAVSTADCKKKAFKKLKDANDLLLEKDGFKELKRLVKSIAGLGIYEQLLQFKNDSSLKVYWSLYDKKYYFYLNDVIAGEGVKSLEQASINLRSFLVEKNVLKKEKNVKVHSEILKEIKTFLVEETISFYQMNYMPKYKHLDLIKKGNKVFLNTYLEDGAIAKVKGLISEDKIKNNISEEDFPSIAKFLSMVTGSNYGDDTPYKWMLNFLAYKVQKPYKKFPRAVIMYGLEGTGKGTIAKLLHALFGENCSPTVGQATIQSGFNTFMKNKLFFCGEEVTELGNRSKTGDILKDLISNDIMELNEKFEKNNSSYSNYANAFFFSNAIEPLKVSATDRRFIVFYLKHKDESERIYAEQVFNDFYNNLEKEVIYFAKYLLELELWEDGVPVLKNKARVDLIRVSKNNTESFVDELAEDYRNLLYEINENNKHVKLPTLSEKFEDVNTFTHEVTTSTKDVDMQFIKPYAIELKQEENKLIMSANLFVTLLRLKYDIKSSNQKIYATAKQNSRFTYKGTTTRLCDGAYRGAVVEIVLP